MMKALKAERMRIRLGEQWESPVLHVLFTREDDVVVARCLDFTVSSHGKDESEALISLANAIREYIATALETQALDAVFDPAHRKYWRMFDEAESMKSKKALRRSLRKSETSLKGESIRDSNPEICYA